jgi:hypothetical protein
VIRVGCGRAYAFDQLASHTYRQQACGILVLMHKEDKNGKGIHTQFQAT